MALYELTCYSEKDEIHLTNYADLIVTDDKNNIVGMRFGGYPEQVTAMTDAIAAGCAVEAKREDNCISFTSRNYCNFSRKVTYDGIYAESMMFLKDSDINATGSDNPPRTMYIYCKTDEKAELFSELDKKLSVPMISSFCDYLIDELQKKEMLQRLTVYSETVQLAAYRLAVKGDEKDVVKILGRGLKCGDIKIPGEFKGKDIFEDFKGFSDYLQQFGPTIAEKIKDSFTPLFDPENEQICERLNEVNRYVKANVDYELFDAQLAAAEGLKRSLDNSKLAMIVAECGTGKTKIGSAALYAHQKKKSFNAVICPSHICEKWVRELHETIPNCYARVIDNFTDIDKMYSIFKTGNQSVYCVISKEKARDGYMKQPSVVWSKIKKAFVCPDCGETQTMPYFRDGIKFTVNADSLFYLRQTSQNHKCRNCKTPLWSALNPDNHNSQWVKISDYGFVHRDFAHKNLKQFKLPQKYVPELQALCENPNMIIPAKGAFRRYPISLYIKNHIKHLDGLIIDELHQYCGDSGQGQSMADLAQVAKKVVAMTGTLINGYSKGMFYLLYRLAPALMQLDEQKFSKSSDFCKQYGIVERVFTQEKVSVNSNSKAKRSPVREKFLPGVSPLVYTRFLLDNTVFLSLLDMGKELPDYEEIPVSVTLDDEIKEEYTGLQDELLRLIKQDERMAHKLMSTYLNLLTAYPDQPYGHPPIMNPFVEGDVLVTPKNIGDKNSILPKDKEVIELVERKVKSGEKVIIYTAWTRLDTREKLYNLLTEKGYRVKILDTSVSAKKREAWVEKKLKNGIDVLITNPALVETGLDLNAFTTLIFFNLAFNLYVFRQASRRSWRINQTAPKVEVYMFYYAVTLQHKALKLMANKLTAATIIEGGISDEGLAAMSDCEDMTSKMAKELALGIKDSVEDLSAAFKKMALIKEVADNEAATEITKPVVIKKVEKSNNTVQYTLFDLLAG